MRTSWISVALFLTGLLVVPPWADAKPPPCPGGRYLVTGSALTEAPGVREPDVVDVAGRMVSVQSGCDAAKARVRATAKGTKIRVKWKTCPGLAGKAIMNALMMEQCRELNGTFVAKSAGIVKGFRAELTSCGDGVWDAGGGEECDGSHGPCGSLCAACACPGGVTTTTLANPGGTTSTTTTPTSGSSTSTSTMPAFPTTSTTTTTLAGSDLAGLDWMSPGSAPSGVNITVQFTVKNFGTAPAVGPWYDYILLSNDYALGNDTAVAVVQRVANVAAGAQYTVLVPQVQMPAVPPGIYYLFLHTDGANAVAETNEPNNVGGFVQLTITP